jgi:adenosine kinase
MAKDKILVVGSLAYDHVMQYDGRIKDVMVHGNYNMAFTASSRAIFYGGCAGNISYSLRLLGEKPIIMTVVGSDFKNYNEWLKKRGIDVSAIFESERHLTASAFIITDKEQNQITFFDPGAMNSVVTDQHIGNIKYNDIAWAIIAPDVPQRMVQLAEECSNLDIPYIFDPAQQIEVFKKKSLLTAIENASILIVNGYESELLSKKLGISKYELASMTPIYIETHGERGCSIITSGGTVRVKAVRPIHIIDPTGCGDAFRSGVLMGLRNGYPIKKACRIGSLVATYSIEQFGTQAHSFSKEEFAKRYEKSFGEPLN